MRRDGRQRRAVVVLGVVYTQRCRQEGIQPGAEARGRVPRGAHQRLHVEKRPPARRVLLSRVSLPTNLNPTHHTGRPRRRSL